jgi:hypothetical protein
MPYGFPDSWVVWGGRKAGRKIFKGSRPKLPSIRIGGGRGYAHTKTVFKYNFSHLSWEKHSANYYREFHTQDGYLWKYLDKQGKLATTAAKKRMMPRANKPWRTGRLAKSIHKKQLGYTNKSGQYVMIGSWTVPYALMVHRGTKPHTINPKGDNQLVFMGKGGGRGGGGMKLVRTNQVKHPGSRRNRYLYDQLRFFKSTGRVPMYTPNYIERARYKIK